MKTREAEAELLWQPSWVITVTFLFKIWNQ